ncbi:MAG: hypothetical protein CYPHOPRED_004274, partial [Cyphobasidiales sp. Tagirdzhanova-0007]
MQDNKANFFDSSDKSLRFAEAPYNKPEAGQVVIKNLAWAINPVDWQVQGLLGAAIQ